jgi:hypothetical protein
MMSKPLTPKQLEARRLGGLARAAQIKQDPDHQRRAGLAMRAKVHRDYYRKIGRLGGRRGQFLLLISIADNYVCLNCRHNNCKMVTLNPAYHQRLVEEVKDHYRQEAYEKYFDLTGNMIMLELFRPE